jgi:hypothetical protein
MAKARRLLKYALTRRAALVILITLTASLLAVDSRGQSGRKLPNRSEPPPAPTTSPDPAPPAEPKPEKIQTKVLIARNHSAAYAAPIMAGIVMNSCADHLKKSSAGISVSVGREMNRKQASDFAKATPDVFVLWLELEADGYDMQRSPTQGNYRDAYRVMYTVYAPVTGKSKTSGTIYPRPYQPRVGGTPIPSPVPRSGGTATIEYMLRQSGEELAERVLDALKLVIPGRN